MAQTGREVSLTIDADTREAAKKSVEQALSGEEKVLWLTDAKGREVAFSTERIAYVEIDSPDSAGSIGFGA